LPTDNEFTRILGWPGYRVYRHEIDEKAKTLKLWIRRKRGNRKIECSGCRRKFTIAYDVSERAVRDLPWSSFTATVFIEIYRVNCPDCGVKREAVLLLPGKAPFSKRFEDSVGLACEMASARQVARQFGLPASTVRAIDLRYLERWNASRRKPALRQMGVDEIYLGKKEKFLSVVCNLETGEPLWFGRERKRESLDKFFQTELSARQRRGIEAACVDMWKPYRLSIEQWAPNCRIIYDKFHIMQHANAAIDEVRRAEFFRKGGRTRGVAKGKRWLLLSRWVNLDTSKKRQLNTMFALNRRVMKGIRSMPSAPDGQPPGNGAARASSCSASFATPQDVKSAIATEATCGQDFMDSSSLCFRCALSPLDLVESSGVVSGPAA
jgi:transposase